MLTYLQILMLYLGLTQDIRLDIKRFTHRVISELATPSGDTGIAAKT